MKREMVFCKDCGYLGSIEAGDEIPVCPRCGMRLIETSVDRALWNLLTDEEKHDTKNHWKMGNTGLVSSLEQRKINHTMDIFNKVEMSDNAIDIREEFRNWVKKNSDYYKCIYLINGCRGRSIEVYENRVVINTDVTMGSILTENATDGAKTIFYKDVIGIQYKSPGLTIGYLQLETASGQMNLLSSNQFSENTFTFNDETDEIVEMKEFISWRVYMTKIESEV